MKKRKTVIEQNYLDNIPVRNPSLRFTTDEAGAVTLEIDNTGFVNRLAQKLLKKPKVTYIHLDENGSFVWPLIDGQTSIFELGKAVDAHFGEAAHPLYERLARYFQILEGYGFVTMKK